jgi:predicted transcriptional regulator
LRDACLPVPELKTIGICRAARFFSRPFFGSGRAVADALQTGRQRFTLSFSHIWSCLIMTTKPTESVTLHMPSDVLAQVETIAEATERSRSQIIVRAVRAYLLQEGGDILNAIEGRAQIAAGEYEDFDDVIAEMDQIIAGKVA